AIFLSYCANYYLRDAGKLAFVLPRSFFSADHHENTRSGMAKGFKLVAAWDMDKVSPLFRVPSCVLFAEKAILQKKIPTSNMNGISFSGKLPLHNCSYEAAMPKLSEATVKWHYIKQGKSSALSTGKKKTQN